MAASQPSGPGAAALIEQLVPTPRRSRLALVVLSVMLVTVALIPRSGVLRPRLTSDPSGGSGSMWSALPEGGPVVYEFGIRNAGWSHTEVRGVEARAGGLPSATATFFTVDDTVRPNRRLAVAAPVRLDPGDEVMVRLEFDSHDCAAIEMHRDTVAVRARNSVGIDTTVSLSPGHFTRPFEGTRWFTGKDPFSIGWSAGITWRDCHGPSGAQLG